MDIDTPNYMTVDTLETLLGPENIIDAPPDDLLESLEQHDMRADNIHMMDTYETIKNVSTCDAPSSIMMAARNKARRHAYANKPAAVLAKVNAARASAQRTAYAAVLPEERASLNAARASAKRTAYDAVLPEERASLNAARRTAYAAVLSEERASLNATRSIMDRANYASIPECDRLQKNLRRSELLKSRPSNKLARHANEVLNCTQKVELHSLSIHKGTPAYGSKICSYCGAIQFPTELESTCCLKGKVTVPPFPTSTPRLREFLEGDSPDSRCLKRYIRCVNQALSFASLTVRYKPVPWGTGYNPNVVIAGKPYYNIGPVQASAGDTPRNMQLYVHDPEIANAEFEVRANALDMFLPTSTAQSERTMLRRILRELQEELHEYNPYVKFLKHLYAVQYQYPALTLALSERDLPENSTRRYTSHHSPEIAVLIDDDSSKRDIVLHHKGGGIKRIEDTHRAVDPLFFVLLHPTGHPGWRLGLRRNDNKTLSGDKYYRYLLYERADHSVTHFYAGRLFQEWCCLMYAKSENQRLNWQRFHQKELRADLYKNVVDHLHKRDAEKNIGKRVILAPSFIGSPRNMSAQYHDAMAVMQRYTKPSFLITKTTNPYWKEITDALFPGQTWRDRPELVARVFRLKVQEMIADLTKHGIFGRRVAHFLVIEFQKHGIPHVHVLLILHPDDELRTPNDVDDCVCAELPPDPMSFDDLDMRKQAQSLEDIIVHRQIHGPCGTENPTQACMYDNQGEQVDTCQRHYPMPFLSETLWDEDHAHPLYRRRSPAEGGRVITVTQDGRTRVIDNGWVVPYNPYMSLKYGCHLNVEVCISLLSAKYLYKYLCKGSDRAMARPEDPTAIHDEISEYQDMRSIGASEACWRLYEFPMGDRYPAVEVLQVHLPDLQHILFAEGCEENAVQKSKVTRLTGFFEWNKAHVEEAQSLQMTYQDFPEHLRWQKVDTEKQWCNRLKRTDTIGRLVSLHPAIGDVFYLRMLLCHEHSIGKTSFEDMQTVNGQLLDSYQAVCAKLGLLQDDGEWDMALADAAVTQMCPQIRELFVELLMFCSPSDPRALFDTHCHEWWDDFAQRTHISDERLLRNMVLMDLERRLSYENKTLTDYRLPTLTNEQRAECSAEDLCKLPHELRYQLEHDRDYLQAQVHQRYYGDSNGHGKYLPAQKAFHDAVMYTVTHPEVTKRCFFLDARAGTGKTYIENGLLAEVRLLSNSSVALAVAVSATAGIQLLKGGTFHSTFKVPIVGLCSTTIFNIRAGTVTAEIMKAATLIVWDEGPTAHKHMLEGLNRTLQDICEDARPFAGKVIVVSGDFRQTLPVIPRANRAGIVKATLKKSILWPLFQIYTLTDNMRVINSGNTPECIAFDTFLMTLGNGTRPVVAPPDYVELPKELCMNIDSTNISTITASMQELINWTFPDFRLNYLNSNWLAQRAVFAPLNSVVDHLNALCLDAIPGEPTVLHSADAVVNLDQAADFGIEFLNMLRAHGMPAHRLNLKPGCIIMLLRNLSKHTGMCNGTRLIYHGTRGKFLLWCTIVTGDHKGTEVLIPRIITQPSDYTGQPCEWRRLQFPVRLAFSMTINKSQGQTLKRVGVWLEQPVFTHGQLYVAASRVGDPKGVRFAIKQHKNLSRYATRNVVYKEIL